MAFSGTTPARVQFVVSGKFIALLLLSCALLGGGYYWYNRQLQVDEHFSQVRQRFESPPYFVNRGASVIRSCQQCLDVGKLKPQAEWKVGPPKEISGTEQHWFLAAENPPLPVTVSGVLMLPVFSTFHENPALGFNQTRVVLVLYQNLERKPWIEQPPPPVASSPTPAAAEPTVSDPDTKQ